MNIARRRGMARAPVAVARKLAVILHRMWADATEFRFERSLFTLRRELRQIEEQATRTKPSPERAMPGSFSEDDGRGDLVESPEPAGPSAARS